MRRNICTQLPPQVLCLHSILYCTYIYCPTLRVYVPAQIAVSEGLQHRLREVVDSVCEHEKYHPDQLPCQEVDEVGLLDLVSSLSVEVPRHVADYISCIPSCVTADRGGHGLECVSFLEDARAWWALTQAIQQP